MGEQAPAVELEPTLAQAYAATFIPRWDRYPLQLSNGSYIQIKKPLKLATVIQHLTNHWRSTKPVTIGAYGLASDSTARWLCFDADTWEQWEQVWHLAGTLQRQGVTSYAEQSRRGGHLWLFLNPQPGAVVRAFGHYLLATHGIVGVELYPKQDRLGNGPGSLVRLPLGVHQKTGRVYPFVSLDGNLLAPTITDQIHLLSQPERVPPAFIESVLQQAEAVLGREQQPESVPHHPPLDRGETLSEAIKNAITVYDFVSQYVELDNTNCGHCPFHDDEHQSFQVDAERNFWHCYAGCGSGSVIDFAMKWREAHGEDGSFTETVRALRELLLG